MRTHVTFPNLGLDFSMNRRLIEFDALGGGIYYYAVIIVLGFFLAYLYVTRQEKRAGKSTEPILDMLLYALPVAIIFARAYYVIFSFDSYKDNLLDVFKIWEGGIAIYGGIIGAVLVVFLYCRKKSLSVLHYLDLLSMGLLIGQSVGRWGNFVNGEAHGSLCDTAYLLGMYINGEGPYHPTFFYESALNITGFLLIHFLAKKIHATGFRLYSYLVWYGTVRFFVEGLRTDSLYLGSSSLRVSQALSAALAITGVVLLFFLFRKIRQKNAAEQ